MNNKAQINGLTVIIMMFITILVGVIFFQAIEQSVGESTNTADIANQTISVVNQTTTFLNFRALNDVIVTNASSGEVIIAANYTVTNNVINPADGALSTSIIMTDEHVFITNSWNISGTAQPTTYVADSGARSMAQLIGIFFALAVLVAAIVPSIRNEFLDLVKR